MTEIPLKGNVREFPPPRVLIYLNRIRKTGTLIVSTHVFTEKVYIDKGDVIFASSTYEDDRLGEMLIKAGKISFEQYEESVRLLQTTKKRQGVILVELGYITPKDLFWGVKYQVKEIIYSLFPLDIAEYKFLAMRRMRHCSPRPSASTTTAHSMNAMLVDACMTMESIIPPTVGCPL